MLADARPESVTYSSTVATNALLEKKGARVALFTNARLRRPDRDRPAESRRPVRAGAVAARAAGQPRDALRRRRAHAVRRQHHQVAEPRGAGANPPARGPQRRGGIRDLPASFIRKSERRGIDRASARVPRKAALGLASDSRRVSRIRALLDRGRECVRRAADVVASEKPRDRVSRARGLRVMQSNGSAIGTELARAEPVRTILSGPAAGVIGAASLARAFGTDRFITFDMGGTSTDVSLFDRRARIRTLSHPDGYAVRTPVIDIHTVGAGGGSIARIDAGGSLRVGPDSAGADPGPACYGRGELCTVTDADLVAGRLVAENFLGGQMKLYPERAERARIASWRATMKTNSLTAARGVIRVVNANMERAIRVITVERGYDPRDFALLAFGGAGPMHACELALDLGIRQNRDAAKSRPAVRVGRVERAAGPRVFAHGARDKSELSKFARTRRGIGPSCARRTGRRRSARDSARTVGRHALSRAIVRTRNRAHAAIHRRLSFDASPNFRTFQRECRRRSGEYSRPCGRRRIGGEAETNRSPVRKANAGFKWTSAGRRP